MRHATSGRKPGRILFGVMTAAFAVAFIGADGCSSIEPDPTPVRTFKITPAADTTRPPGAATATPSPAAQTPAGTPASGVIEIAGISNEFDVEEVEAAAGSVTVHFDNRDGGVLHNIHFFRGSDDDGESVAETELEVGPIEQTLTFDVEPGEYFYQCDAHPTTMTGTLRVR